MKRLLTSAVLFLCCIVTSFAQFSGSGSGTESDPYLILNPIQLNQLRNFVNRSGVYFKLMADIDLTEYIEDENSSQGWLPIGTSSTPFKGILDGNGKTVSGLWINRPNSDYVGFFGSTYGAKIKNLTLIGESVIGKNYVGVLSAYSSSSTISNCTLSASLSGASYVGGTVGKGASCTMNNISSYVNVICSGDYTGGIIGYIDGSGSISDCRVKCNSISGVNYVGGACGANRGTVSFATCYISANLNGNKYVGGVVGQIQRASQNNMTNCNFFGDVNGTSYVGGICGLYVSKATMKGCYAVAHVVASGNYVGGLVGETHDIDSGSNCVSLLSNYFSGSVSGCEQVGGLIGHAFNGTTNCCYANAVVNGSKTIGGLIGKIEGLDRYNHGIISSCVAICSSVKATEGNVGRIYGERGNYVSIGENGTTSENKAWNRIIMIDAGVAHDITDDEQNGTGVSSSTLKLKATYVTMGWDFTDTWMIQETECYPYFKSQTAPPVITSNVVSGATIIYGNCVDGGTITLEVDDLKQQLVSSGNSFSFTVSPLQAGHEVRISAKAEGKEMSYYTTETVSYLGKGTETDPYQIYTAADLTGVYRKGYFKLMNDIDLTDYINLFNPTEGWESIGREGSETVYFDGNGHKVTGLWCNTTRDNTGLFSCFANGYIKNLTVETANGKQVKGGANTGILIGKMINGTIENCCVSGNVADGTPVGGLVGLFDGGTISLSQASVTINTSGATSYVGGIVGVIFSGVIDQCVTLGTLTATGQESYVGGLVGKNYATVTNCYSNASVISSYNAAGLIAYNYGVLDKCYATGNLYSSNYAAGVIGYNDGEDAIVRNCVAMNSIIEIVYESQQVQQGGGYGQRIIGGIKNNAPAPEMNNYALKTMQVSVNDVAQRVYDDIMNGVAKTTVELMSANTYQGIEWDFSTIWGIEEGANYPFLLWNDKSTPVAGISFDKTTLIIAIGSEETITASVMPLGATNKRLNWTSSNEAVATVDNGVVTAVAVGTATITASATDGSGVTATCQVTVTANKEAAIAALQALVDEAQTLYDNSTEGEDIGEYAPGSRAALLAVINSVRAQISSTMSDEAINQCTADINAAIEAFESQKVTASEDTDYGAIANTIYLERVEGAAGSQVTLSVKMKNTVEVQGYQFDLYLPEGVTVATDEDGFSLIELSTERTTTRKTDYFNSTVQADGSIRVLCGSSKGYTFEGNDGEVATITLNISEDMEEGDYPIILKEVNLTDRNSTLYATAYLKSTLSIINFILGDVNGNKKVEVADFIATANYILGNPPQVFIFKAGDLNNNKNIEVSDFIGIANIILNSSTSSNAPAAAPKKGPRKAATDISTLTDVIYVEPVTATPGTQQTLSIQMKNSSPVAGFEFRLQLPEGITVAQEDGFNLAELSTERTTARKTDYFNTALQDDGTLQVLCGTSTADPNTGKPYVFSGNEGEVARITVNIPEDYADGVYEMSILDAAFSDADNNLTEVGQTVTTELTIGDNTIVLDEDSEDDIETTDAAVNIRVRRTIAANQWSTICLPFNMTAEQVYASFGDDVQLQAFDSYDVDYDDDDNVKSILVHFGDIDIDEEGFYANYPYLIKVSEPVEEFTVRSILEPDEESAIAEYDNGKTGRQRKVYGTFYGTYHAQTTVPESCLFISNNKFWYSTGLTKMKAFRGYFEFVDVLADMANANISFSFDGTTGIHEILNRSMADGAVYTIQGQFVGKDIDLKKLPRGIYIINGKKQVIK